MSAIDHPERPPASPLLGTRREILMGAALLGAAALAYARKPREHEQWLGTAKLDTLVPGAFAGWRYQTSSGLVLPPPDQLRDAIYSELLTRTYMREDGTGVMLLIAYSKAQDGVLQVHRPEVCYPASGYTLTRVDPAQIHLARNLEVSGRYIVAENEARREQLIYWTRLGSHFPTRWAEQRLAVIRENLAGIIPDGVLVRISSVAPGDALPLLEGFAASMFASVNAQMRRVLVG